MMYRTWDHLNLSKYYSGQDELNALAKWIFEGHAGAVTEFDSYIFRQIDQLMFLAWTHKESSSGRIEVQWMGNRCCGYPMEESIRKQEGLPQSYSDIRFRWSPEDSVGTDIYVLGNKILPYMGSMNPCILTMALHPVKARWREKDEIYDWDEFAGMRRAEFGYGLKSTVGDGTCELSGKTVKRKVYPQRLPGAGTIYIEEFQVSFGTELYMPLIISHGENPPEDLSESEHCREICGTCFVQGMVDVPPVLSEEKFCRQYFREALECGDLSRGKSLLRQQVEFRDKATDRYILLDREEAFARILAQVDVGSEGYRGYTQEAVIRKTGGKECLEEGDEVLTLACERPENLQKIIKVSHGEKGIIHRVAVLEPENIEWERSGWEKVEPAPVMDVYFLRCLQTAFSQSNPMHLYDVLAEKVVWEMKGEPAEKGTGTDGPLSMRTQVRKSRFSFWRQIFYSSADVPVETKEKLEICRELGNVFSQLKQNGWRYAQLVECMIPLAEYLPSTWRGKRLLAISRGVNEKPEWYFALDGSAGKAERVSGWRAAKGDMVCRPLNWYGEDKIDCRYTPVLFHLEYIPLQEEDMDTDFWWMLFFQGWRDLSAEEKLALYCNMLRDCKLHIDMYINGQRIQKTILGKASIFFFIQKYVFEATKDSTIVRAAERNGKWYIYHDKYQISFVREGFFVKEILIEEQDKPHGSPRWLGE